MIYAASKNKRTAFTIVELVIVISIIGILAAITVVSYSAVVTNAKKQTVATGAQDISAALKKYKSENGAYPSTLSALSWKSNNDSTYQYAYDSTNDGYCVTASVKGASAYILDSSNTAQVGGCPGHGVDGLNPITNLAYDPAATTYATLNTQAGWRNDRYGASGTYTLVTSATDGPTTGLSTYARMTFSQAVSTSRGFHFVGNPEGASPGTNGMTVSAGTTYTVSAYLRSMRTSGGTVAYTIGIRFSDASNAWLAATSSGSAVTAAAGSPTTNPGPWVRPTVTVTAPANAVRAQIYVRETTAPTHNIGDAIDGTGLMITASSTVNTYADGSSSSWIWNGTENASTSTGPEL